MKKNGQTKDKAKIPNGKDDGDDDEKLGIVSMRRRMYECIEINLSYQAMHSIRKKRAQTEKW